MSDPRSAGLIELPDMDDVKRKLKGEETPLAQRKIDLHALMYAALIHSLNKRNARLIRPKNLRYGHRLIGVNPFKRHYVIGRVKRAQLKNLKKSRRVYKRAEHGGHF